ncbi:unnamed protein product [Gordionus sp. m RMFG-2023]
MKSPKLKFLFELTGHPKRILYIRIWRHLITSFSLQGDARLWCLETGNCLQIVNFGMPFDEAIFYFHLPPYTRLKNFSARGDLFLYLKEGTLLISNKGVIYTKRVTGLPHSFQPVALSLVANVLALGVQSSAEFRVYFLHFDLGITSHYDNVSQLGVNGNINYSNFSDIIAVRPTLCVYRHKIASPADNIQYLDLSISHESLNYSTKEQNSFGKCTPAGSKNMRHITDFNNPGGQSNHILLITTRRKLHIVKFENDYFYPRSKQNKTVTKKVRSGLTLNQHTSKNRKCMEGCDANDNYHGIIDNIDNRSGQECDINEMESNLVLDYSRKSIRNSFNSGFYTPLRPGSRYRSYKDTIINKIINCGNNTSVN